MRKVHSFPQVVRERRVGKQPSQVTNVLTGEECEVLEELWHDDLLQLLRGNKSQASQWSRGVVDVRMK